MSKSISFIDILKSRYGSEKDLPAWVHKRRSICDTCPLNSKNKPRKDWTAQEKTWVTFNHGKPTCLACKCMIEAKTKIDYAVCGLEEIGLEPKWKEVDTIAKTANIKMENMSTTPLSIHEEKGEIWLNYGTIKIGEPTDVQILIKDINNNMSDIEIGTSCGCTESKIEKHEQDILLTIVYDTKREGDFTKSVILSYKQNNLQFKKIFKITGKTE